MFSYSLLCILAVIPASIAQQAPPQGQMPPGQAQSNIQMGGGGGRMGVPGQMPLAFPQGFPQMMQGMGQIPQPGQSASGGQPNVKQRRSLAMGKFRKFNA